MRALFEPVQSIEFSNFRIAPAQSEAKKKERAGQTARKKLGSGILCMYENNLFICSQQKRMCVEDWGFSVQF